MDICSGEVQSKAVACDSRATLETEDGGFMLLREDLRYMKLCSCSGPAPGLWNCHPTPLPALFPLFLPHPVEEELLIHGTVKFGLPPPHSLFSAARLVIV